MEEEPASLFKLVSPIHRQEGPLEPVKIDGSLLDSFLDTTVIPPSKSSQTGIRKRGEVPTPSLLVQRVLDLVGYVSKADLRQYHIIDPACGDGSFLRECVSRLRDTYTKAGLDPLNENHARRMISGIQQRVAGIELSSTAARKAALGYLEPLKDLVRTILEKDPGYLPHPSVYEYSALSPDLRPNVLFDFVVGNPPYVRHPNLSKKLRMVRREGYLAATGRFDEYVLFFELALRLLKRKGTLAFLSSDRFLTSSYGSGLRRLLLDRTHISWIIRLPEEVFEGVSAYPIVTVASKIEDHGQLSAITRYLDLRGKRAFKSFNSETKIFPPPGAIEIPQSDLGPGSWSFVPRWASEFIGRLRKSMPHLDSIAEEIRSGIATGANDVFVFHGKPSNIESELLLPVLAAPDIQKGQINWSGNYVLNPYQITNSELGPVDLARFPRARAYLESQRGFLEEKYHSKKAGKSWYVTHDIIDSRMLSAKKIVTPDLATSNRFAVDTGHFVCLNTCYVLLFPERTPLETLAAILDSSLLEFIFKLATPRASGNHYRYMKQFIKSLPVPDPSNMPSDLISHLSSAYRDKDWNAINEIVFDFYEVPERARRRISDSVSQSQP